MKKLLIFLFALLFVAPLYAQASYQEWLVGLKQQAVEQGISADFLDRTFRDIEPNKRVTHFAKTQPEHRITFPEYRDSRASKYRVLLGKRKYQQYKQVLTKIGINYGVDPAYIVAIWGMETSYGNFMGDFSVIRALTSLAYEGRRTEYFRNELLIALHILYEGHVHPDKFKGEWAGASGHPQFMPSSWEKYAEDYDGDGRKDIWETRVDAFASIANYLKQKGWHRGEPVRIEVAAKYGIDHDLRTLKMTKSVHEWESGFGVHSLNGGPLPYQNLQASIIQPDGGPYFLVFNNFKVLMQYNNSTYYAGTLAYIADQIRS